MSSSVSRKPTLTSGPAGDGEVHVFDYLRVLYRRRWIALPVFLVIFVSSAINTVQTTPVYEARAELLIEKDSSKVTNINELFQQQESWFNDDFYQTQYRILQSRSLARRAISDLQMWRKPDFDGGVLVSGGFSITGLVRTGIASIWRVVKPPMQDTARASRLADETADQSAVIDAFLGRLTVLPIRNSRLVDVKFASASPEMAARMANALAQAYIDQNVESRFSASKDASGFLKQQLDEQRKKVEETEAALQRYKEQNDAVAVDDRQNIVVQKLGDMNAAVTRAKTERIAKEALYNQLKATQASGSIDSFPAVLANEYIQKVKSELSDLVRRRAQLAEKYGAKHPQMVAIDRDIQTAEAKLKVETDKVAAAVYSEYQAALANEQSLMGALESQKREMLRLNQKGIQYSVLARDAQSNRQLFDNLLQQVKETGVSGQWKAENVRIVDRAETPRAPVLPRTSRDITLALLLAGMCACGVGFLFEYLDNRIKSPQEVKAYLDLPFLGMIPTLSDKADRALINNGVPADFAESFRSVRTSVLFSSAEEGAHKLVVTSSGPGEGKSLIASNMAVALAQAGQRVLFIDGDMRRPRDHEIFGETQEPGLSNVLTGNSKMVDSIRNTSIENLKILPSGVIPPNPAELLSAKRYKEFLESVRHDYDWIVIDSPPVLAVADASIHANVASGVLFVIAADRTTRQAARAALEQLRAADAKMIGAVLNGVNVRRNPYYYSHYYRKDYGRYYVKHTHSNN